MSNVLSIIVPVYNVQDYIDETIKSILNQTISDFELILVNDGSQDQSGQICKEYASKDSRIKYVEQKKFRCDDSKGNRSFFIILQIHYVL